MGADVLYRRDSASTAEGVSAELDTTNVDALAVDINFTAFTGGTTPSVTFFLERLGADGVWYTPVSTGPITVASKISIDLTSALGVAIVAAPLTSAAQHMVIGKRTRLRWAFGGGVAPTAVTFSASIIGRRTN